MVTVDALAPVPQAANPQEFVLKPDVRDDQNEGEVYSTPVIGIIYPPPELRNIVDKTASFVARNGVEFESRIRQSEANNPKFNFLTPGDPYHAYYEHKVGEFIQGKGQEPQIIARPYSPPPTAVSNLVQDKLRQQVKTLLVLKDPPPEFEFFADPPSISSFDLEVVKLTAQCVAKNGKEFLSELMDKEKSNFQFDFLKPQHSLFDYFTRLVEQYTKVLLPQKTIVRNLRQEAQEPRKVLEAARYRAEWYRRDLREKEREQEEHEKERVAYAQIDWHDFTVVETIDYQPWEEGEFPAPTTPEEVGARSLLYERMLQEQQQKQAPAAVAAENDDITVEMEIEDDARPDSPRREEPKEMIAPPITSSMPPPILNPAIPGNIIIRPYNPKVKPIKDTAPQPTEFVVSPITGERIPVSKLQEHLKYSLLDPEFLQQRDRQLQEKVQQEHVYAPGSAIGDSLKQLAERRSDIFGSGAEETSIGRKIGDTSSEQNKRIIWDGFAESSGAVIKAAAKNVTSDEQRKHDYEMAKIQGLVPDPDKDKIGPQSTGSSTSRAPPTFSTPSVPVLRPPSMGMSFLPPTPSMLFPVPHVGIPRSGAASDTAAVSGGGGDEEDDEDEPSAKKMKQDNAAEEEFLKLYKGPITFKVQVPHVADKPEWKLNGQMLNLTLGPKETVTIIKTKIQEQLGVPLAKQKLQFEGVYVKDSQSLAACNITPGAMVQLQLKERGGRKK